VTLDQFNRICDLPSLLEVDKVCYLAFFHLKTHGMQEFTAADGARWLNECGCATPNQSRLDQNLRANRNTVRGQRGWRLTLEFVRSLEPKFSALSETSQDVVDDGTILPPIDYTNTRGYIETLAKQINASYEHNLFDACAVLMRRLVEVLLVLSYRHHQIESSIQDNVGNYQMLEGIINNAKTNGTLALSRNSKGSLETFRELGNFSAHKIEYICRREYIRPHIQEYRALIVELLHKAAIRT
jgi:hypothetical protein